jgi:hypothetical protein
MDARGVIVLCWTLTCMRIGDGISRAQWMGGPTDVGHTMRNRSSASMHPTHGTYQCETPCFIRFDWRFVRNRTFTVSEVRRRRIRRSDGLDVRCSKVSARLQLRLYLIFHAQQPSNCSSHERWSRFALRRQSSGTATEIRGLLP